MLGTDGSRGLTHPRVDKLAGVPAGTTSYYFRTRKALLHAVAERLTELDVDDLSLMDEVSDQRGAGYSGTLGLANLVMLSGTEPYLTRTRARFEIILLGSQDADLAATVQSYGIRFYATARAVVARWYDDPTIPDAEIESRAVLVLTFVSGVMTSMVQGHPVVSDAAHLDRLIRQILQSRDPGPTVGA